MASSRKTGTNESVSTYGVGKSYTVLATWEADTDNDLVATTISPVLECYDNGSSFNDYVTLDGSTTSSSYFRIIRPAVGNKHNGTPNTGVRFANTTAAHVFYINESYSQVQDLVAKSTFSSASYFQVFYMHGVGSMTIGCIAYDSANSGTGITAGFYADANLAGPVDCLSHNNEGAGFSLYIVSAGQNAFAYNCTATNNGAPGGFRAGGTAGTTTLKNCLASDNITDFVKVSTVSPVVTYCASKDATADDWAGAGNRINQTFTFVDSANDNFHLASTDAGAINYGTDLSADGTFAFDDDIDGQTRTAPWDIGADEYVTILPMMMQHHGG